MQLTEKSVSWIWILNQSDTTVSELWNSRRVLCCEVASWLCWWKVGRSCSARNGSLIACNRSKESQNQMILYWFVLSPSCSLGHLQYCCLCFWVCGVEVLLSHMLHLFYSTHSKQTVNQMFRTQLRKDKASRLWLATNHTSQPIWVRGRKGHVLPDG